ncbi:MAG TPA: helix-turn-helix transcriptional regulator [Thermodesulfobacteriota bacterium]|nr:helix-turn-helix transcriptional regulator [Thermodesulfobacteriota bacterium]
MTKKERLVISAILVLIAVLTFIDIFNDYLEGVAFWHISVETIIGLAALAGVYYLIKSHFTMQRTLEKEKRFSNELNIEAQKWKRVSKAYVDGLSVEINKQLDKWELTNAEKRVAFLLLKGLSIKEIADLRKTSEKTVRTQANSIYFKSGLPGRSSLSAFFLEDLLPPKL